MYRVKMRPGRLAAFTVLLSLLTASPSAIALRPSAGGKTPHLKLLLPAQYGGRSVVCEELRQRRIVNQHQMNDRLRNLLLFDASERGCIELMTDLLSKGASVEARDRFGNTALLRAARAGENEALRLLIEKKSDLHHQNIAGSTALLRAVTMNRRRTAKILLEAGADPNTPSRRNVSPLIAAAYNGNVRIAEMLIRAGASPELLDATGKAAIVYAAAKGYPRIVAMLLDAGLGVDERYAHGLTALMWAAGHTNDVPVAEGLITVRLLLERGAAPDLVEDRGRSALMIAAERGHAEVVEALLEAGSDDKRRDARGKTAADLAANDAVRRLLVPD
jgi:ankyrin repeat protein